MLQSETFMRAVHADRVRDLERAARDRRLLAEPDETAQEREPVTRPRVAPSTGRGARGDSAGMVV